MTDVSAGFRPPCWCPSRWAPAWRLHTNLYKFGKNVSPHIFRKKNCCDLNLGESLCLSTFFLFPDSRLIRLNGFYCLFWSILNGVTLKTSNIRCGSRVFLRRGCTSKELRHWRWGEKKLKANTYIRRRKLHLGRGGVRTPTPSPYIRPCIS